MLLGIDGPGGPRQDLPVELGVSRPAVDRLLDVLARRGFLVRRLDPEDRRRVGWR